MPHRLPHAVLILLAFFLPACSSTNGSTVRVATFNTALSRSEAGQLHAAFAKGDDAKAKLVAEVLQRTRPNIVLLQEVDYDPTGQAYADFQRNYLSQSQNGAEPILYEHVYAPPVNTGVLADVDLDGDGQITRPNDCYGYGLFEGQYGMVVLSTYPIETEHIKSYQHMLWHESDYESIPENYYTQEAELALRLSSKIHADVPLRIGSSWLRLWISHPTPPVFDGPEDRNGRRNNAEINFWFNHLLTDKLIQSGHDSPDDAENYVVLGDLNADPNDGESRPGAMDKLLKWLQDTSPTSDGAVEAARLQAGKNLTHKSNPAHDTADFGDKGRDPGNLRVDYVLPSIYLDVIGSGVYWPTTDDPHAYLNKASDHKLVWIDLRLP